MIFRLKSKEMISSWLFFIVLLINSIVYIFINFLNRDVDEVTSFYGLVQLTLVVFIISLILLGNKVKLKLVITLITIIYMLLLFIQIAPSFLWILFNGQIVNDKPYGGVVGSWLYGVYHIFIILWGILNFNAIKNTLSNTRFK